MEHGQSPWCSGSSHHTFEFGTPINSCKQTKGTLSKSYSTEVLLTITTFDWEPN